VTGGVEDLLRELAPQVLGVLVRRYGQFDACEDAVQEALLGAATQWKDGNLPDHPKAWLVSVAARRLIDDIRRDAARRRREDTAAALAGPDATVEQQGSDVDDTLLLLFLCCHPAVTPASQVALTLRAVGGLTTHEIAAAFLVPVTTMGPRISRAKLQIEASGARFEVPSAKQRAARLPVVLQVLYLIFNEGYTASSGSDLQRPDLIAEAMRLTRLVHRMLPEVGEVAGLLALMLLTDARRAARSSSDGALVPLAEQDRTAWDVDKITEGTDLVTSAMRHSPPGPYQLQAAIAALHAEAPSADAADWTQIVALYRVLETMDDSPVVTLNKAVATAMAEGPRAGLALLDTLETDQRMRENHRLLAVRAHLLEMSGDVAAARETFRLAAQRTASVPEQRYLTSKAKRLER
jgi:RNA polymerase sigma factor (sigma-70 family)